MKKIFEIPELTIILFEGDLTADDEIISSGGGFGDWYSGEPGDHDQD